MTPQKIVPFFAELGLLLNLVRRITIAINDEVGENHEKEEVLSNVRYIRRSSFNKIQSGLKQLENEVAYYFTENGVRKAADLLFDSQGIHRKLITTFKSLSSEYFTLKSGHREKITVQQNNRPNIEADIYKIARQRPAVVN